MSHPLYGPEIRELILDDDSEGLRAVCEALHPATLAEALDDEFTPEEIWGVIRTSDVRTQAAIFEYLPIAGQIALIQGASKPEMGRLLGKMSHDDRADLLQRLDAVVRENLLRFVDEADRRDMAMLAQYGSGTVGALMTTDYAWLPPTLTAAEAIDQLRQQAPDRETIYYIYVLGDAGRTADGHLPPRRLLGVITLRDLILAPRHAFIRDLMETELEVLRGSADQQTAAEVLGRYDFIAVPVLDDGGGMIGIVTHDDVLDLITMAATEDLQRQGGVSPISGSYFEAGFGRVWYSRAIWLGILFLAQMFTIEVMTQYDDQLKVFTALSFFIPLCLSVGGNAGSQAATLVTRALALEQILIADWWRVLRREILMGLCLAAALGILALLRTYLLTPSKIVPPEDMTGILWKLTWVIGISVTGICLWGTLLGAMLPIFFKRVGVDPALTSSPFIATISDVSGIFIYFNIAALFFF